MQGEHPVIACLILGAVYSGIPLGTASDLCFRFLVKCRTTVTVIWAAPISEFGQARNFLESAPMPDCIHQLHWPEKEIMEGQEMMELLKMHMTSA